MNTLAILLSQLETDLIFKSISKDEAIEWKDDFCELRAFYEDISRDWHEKRQKEFLLGRYLVHSTLKQQKISSWDNPVVIGENREPVFPSSISASLTHNDQFVVFAMKKGSSCVGVDIEAKGRIKKELERQILHEEDYKILKSNAAKNTSEYSDLLTLIFSAKESCYKALFPFVKEYFGLQDAYIREIDLDRKTFEIEVTKEFSQRESLGLKVGPIRLKGSYIEDKVSIFTYLASDKKEVFKG